MLLVETANRLAMAGLGALLLTLCAMVVLVVDVVFGPGWAAAAAAGALALFVAFWVVTPRGLARFGRFPQNPPPDAPQSCDRASRGRPVT